MDEWDDTLGDGGGDSESPGFNAAAAPQSKRQRVRAAPPAAVRAIVHVDINAFYAAVEEARLWPELVGKPVAVRQRLHLVTCNYVARARGVPKMCVATTGLALCPDLVVIESDMSRYRAANRALMALLAEFTPDTEKGSIDEAYLDVTARCRAAMAADDASGAWPPSNAGAMEADGFVLGALEPLTRDEDRLLLYASRVATSIREALRERLRFESSAGVAHVKPFAKLASNMHKPSAQTVVPVSCYEKLVATTTLHDVPGLGPVMRDELHVICTQRLDAFEPKYLGDLLVLNLRELEPMGPPGSWLYHLARGVDDRPVKDKGPPHSIGFNAAHRYECRNLQEVYGVILLKAEQMCHRLLEDEDMYERVARSLVVSFKFQHKNVTRSMAMPARGENRVFLIASAVMGVLGAHAKKDPAVIESRIFGLSAANFSQAFAGISESSITNFFSAPNDEVPLVDPFAWEPQEQSLPPAPRLSDITRYMSDSAPPMAATPVLSERPLKRRSVVGCMDRYVVAERMATQGPPRAPVAPPVVVDEQALRRQKRADALVKLFGKATPELPRPSLGQFVKKPRP